jgi:tetratricopeptide (TPR) repeat protein
MSWWQRVGLLAALVVGVVAAVFMYWSQHLYYVAEGVEDAEGRSRLLEKAARFNVFNDFAYYGLGKAYFDLGYQNLESAEVSEGYLRDSIESYEKSLRLNPANYFGHYNYARALFHLDFVGEEESDFIEEYKKAALLTGHRSEIFFEVGKVVLSQWEELSDEDKEFTYAILRQVAAEGDLGRFMGILHTWDMNVGDYGVIGQILPENSVVMKVYARFLGERSLSHVERQKVLARAEAIEFGMAKEAFAAGENLFRYYRMREAEEQYTRCLNRLGNIRFYQGLEGEDRIDLREFNDFKRECYLKLAKCGIERGLGLEDVEGFMRDYLGMLQAVADAGELESYLVKKGIVGESLTESLSDLDVLSFHCFLYFKQNRYRDITRVGDMLQDSFVMVPEGAKSNYVKVLRVVGEAYQRLGYLYDATDFYRKALEVDASDLETMLDLRSNYERLNDEVEIRRLERELMAGVLSEREIDLGGRVVAKGQRFGQELVLDGERVRLRVEFGGAEELAPLVSVVFNGRVVWENYVNGAEVELELEVEEGKNKLEIMPVNRQVVLRKIIWGQVPN